MRVQVAYAAPRQQLVVELRLVEGATVAQALAAALPQLPIDDWRNHAVGVYGEVCAEDRVLREADRVEIYRPLVMDAKTARRERAAKQRSE